MGRSNGANMNTNSQRGKLCDLGKSINGMNIHIDWSIRLCGFHMKHLVIR